MNKSIIKQAILDKEIRVICGYPGIGKSFVNSINGNYIDIDSFDYTRINHESYIEKTNDSFPENYYIKVVELLQSTNAIILCSTHKEFRAMLTNNGIKYLLIYPTLGCKKEYLQRYKNRQSNFKWINDQRLVFEKRIIELYLENVSPSFKDTIGPGETLESYLHELGL